jgi:hypothetical protein
MSEGLGDFFKLIVEDKKKKKEEFDNLVGEINLDSLFSEIKGSIEENKKNSKKVQKQVNAFESWLKSETEEEKEEIVIEVADDFKEEVDTTDWRDDYVSTEIETEDLIKPEPLKPTPSVIDQSIKILDEITEEVDPLNDTKFATFDDLKKHYQLFLDRISVQLSSLGGGGIEDAPKTGGPYARRNQAWEVISLSGGGGGGSPGGSDGQIQYNNGGAFGGATQLFYDDSNNRVGINSATPTESLDVIGSVKATDFNTTSDQNLKDNIKTIENPLSKVLSIRGVNFEWKDSNKASAGVIAQEVEKVLPELVTGQNTKTVNYNGLIGLLIETVKEQQKQIDILSEKISKLE